MVKTALTHKQKSYNALHFQAHPKIGTETSISTKLTTLYVVLPQRYVHLGQIQVPRRQRERERESNIIGTAPG